MIIQKQNCTGCHTCLNICPNACISMQNNGEGFWYPEINKNQCIDCGKCENICPVTHKAEVYNAPVSYVAYNKSNQIRLDSSSGGVFSLLGEYIIDRGGVVFGACFDEKENFSVIHDFAKTKEDMSKFRGSKYVQSKIGNTYKLVKKFLDDKKIVLFTGTPCQVGGLKAYLAKEYENLLTQDVICHGVPSPKVWQKYIEYREKYANSQTQRISFRRKDDGWKRYSVSFLFKNDTEYRQTFDKDLMMQTFLKNICLRESCHNCVYKTIHRQSDVTLADFWGIQNIMSHMDDDKGTSLILVNSDKGINLFEEIKDNLIYESVDINTAINHNSAAIRSVIMHKNRSRFFNNIENEEFDILVKKYCTESNIYKIMKLIKNGGFYKLLAKLYRKAFGPLQ